MFSIFFQLGKSDNMVLYLMKDVEKDKHKVFFDNLFASNELMIQLKYRGKFAIGTLLTDR